MAEGSQKDIKLYHNKEECQIQYGDILWKNTLNCVWLSEYVFLCVWTEAKQGSQPKKEEFYTEYILKGGWGSSSSPHREWQRLMQSL